MARIYVVASLVDAMCHVSLLPKHEESVSSDEALSSRSPRVGTHVLSHEASSPKDTPCMYRHSLVRL